MQSNFPLFYQTFEVGDLPPDDVEAGAPEVYALDIDAEAFGEGDGVCEAGGGKEVVVVGAEGVGVCFVASVEAEGEEEAEGVGIVIEGRSVVITIDSLLYISVESNH
ncbi:MAG: hypothetical protein JWN14_1567 [Chthonomonadales bacterium]|nr:hypothetical protein [Chthonomonadales bacterium]